MNLECLSGEESGGVSSVSCESIEETRFCSGAGDQVGVRSGGVVVPPGLDRFRVEVLNGVEEMDAVVISIGVPEGAQAAVAQMVERRVFPVVALAPVDGEFTAPSADVGEGGAESAACGDLGKLEVVTDQDRLHTQHPGVSEDAMEVDGPAHSGLVDNEDVARTQFGVVEEPGNREGVDARAVGEFAVLHDQWDRRRRDGGREQRRHAGRHSWCKSCRSRLAR